MVEGLPSHVKLLLSQSPSTSPLLGYDAVSVPALIPVQHAQKRSTANKPTCRHEGCALQRISQKCARRMCRQHCLLKGGCDTHQLPLSQPPAVLLQPGAPSFTAFAPVTSRGPFDPFGDQDKASSSSQPVFTFTDEDLNAPPPSPNFYQPLRAPPSPLGYSTLPETLPPRSNRDLPRLGDVTKRPKITTQMNPTWMGDYRTTHSAPSQRANVSSATKVKKDVSLIQRFYLVYWDNSSDPAEVHVVDECPDWPHWRLSTYSKLNELATDLPAVKVYQPNSHMFASMSISSLHDLSTHRALLVKRKGVDGVDEDAMVKKFVSPPLRKFRQGISDERAVLRGRKNGKAGSTSKRHADSDSDIEFIEVPAKRRIVEASPIVKEEPTTPCRSLILGAGSSKHPIDVSPAPSSSLSPTPRLFVPPQSTFPPSSRWPRGWYAVDLVEGFKAIDDGLPTGRESREALMERVSAQYGCTNIPYTTYIDQRARWNKASHDLRQSVLAGGHTPPGLWKHIISRVPLKAVQP